MGTNYLVNSNSYAETGGEIPDNSDLNLYLTYGKYYARTAVSAATMINCPTSQGFSMYVIRRTASGYTQLIMDNSGRIFLRYTHLYIPDNFAVIQCSGCDVLRTNSSGCSYKRTGDRGRTVQHIIV